MTAAEKIKELRQSFAISQAQLAKRLGVTRSSVNAWEMGISTPTTQYIVDMAHIFHVSTDCLLGVEDTLPGLEPGEVFLSAAEGVGVRLTGDGKILLTGDVQITGTLRLNGKEVQG